MAPSRRIFSLARLLFLLSGATGLIYQVIWSRLFQDVFGVSAYAVTAVLATYLGGLAVGSFLLGPFVDRQVRPLRTYGLLELGVAAAAVLGALLLAGIEPLHARVAAALPPDSALLLLARMVLASVVVLPPTILMGGTFPAMGRAFAARAESIGREVAFLYALNTAGAVLGSHLAGFWAIRVLGVHTTLWAAIAANVALGLFALLAGAEEPPAEVSPPAPADPSTEAGDASNRWVLVALGLSGFASIALEVLWTRVLTLSLGTTTYAFVTMLSAFLVGIALGSVAIRAVVDRLKNPRVAFGWLEVGIAASTLASIPAARLALLETERWTDLLGWGWMGETTVRFLASSSVMLIPTMLIGATFPLASRIWAKDPAKLGASVGWLQAANTLGNVAGALAGGFVILERFGMQRGIAIVTLFNLLAAAVALLPVTALRTPRAFLRALPLATFLGLCGALLSLWTPGPLPGSAGGPLDPVRFYEEGLVSTVAVFQRAADGRQVVMAADGINIGQSSAGVDHKQQVLAHLPFLLHGGRPQRIYSVGLGTGILVGEVGLHPGVEVIDCAEISPSVIAGARAFDSWNHGVMDDRRLRVIQDDGVNYLRRSTERYDAIISDGKSKSGHAGNGIFYSADYYRVVLDHLADDGVAIQWVPLDMTTAAYLTVVRTFVESFPHAYLWFGPQSSYLVGTHAPLRLDVARIAAALEGPAYENLRRHGWLGAPEISALLLADGPAMKAWLGGRGDVNTTEHPVLEFYDPAEIPPPEEIRQADNAGGLADLQRRGLTDVTFTGELPRDREAEARAVALLLEGLAKLRRDMTPAVRLLRRAASASPDGIVRVTAAESLSEVGRHLDVDGRVADATELYQAARDAWPELVEARANLGRALALQGRIDEAKGELTAALELDPECRLAHQSLAQILQMAGRTEPAVRELEETLRLAPSDPDVHEDLGLALAMDGRPADALAELEAALKLRPEWPLGLARVALLIAVGPDEVRRKSGDALRLARRADELAGGQSPDVLEALATAYAVDGRFEEAVSTEEAIVALAQATKDANLEASARHAAEEFRLHHPPPPLPARGK